LRIIDLSHWIEPSPEGTPDFLRTDVSYATHEEGAGEFERLLGIPRRLLRNEEGPSGERLSIGTHATTHVDAPWHYNSTVRGERAQTIDELPLEWFFKPGVVLDMTHKSDGDPMTAADAQAALQQVGHELAPLDIVLVRTGRDAFYAEPDYMARGCGATFDATKWLYDQGVRVMGIDAWGWDAPLHLQAQEAVARDEPGIFWAAHQADLDYCQIERLFNLGELPPAGFTVACFPLKIVGGSAGPTRAVAIVP
jgi:kynurenine formamidase